MDIKETLKQLLKIAQNQQKMIEKLAQLTNQPLSPQHLAPNAPELHPGDLVMEKLMPAVKASVESILPHGNVLQVKFKPGHATQAALNYITQVVQHLNKAGKFPFAYSVSVA